jgi:hypothetical protein
VLVWPAYRSAGGGGGKDVSCVTTETSGVHGAFGPSPEYPLSFAGLFLPLRWCYVMGLLTTLTQQNEAFLLVQACNARTLLVKELVVIFNLA